DPATSTRRFVLIAGELGQMVFVHDLLGALQAQAPGVAIKFIFPDAQQRVACLEDGRADLALGYLPQLAGGNLFQQQLYSRPLVCVARKGHTALRAGLTRDLFSRLPHLVVASLSNVNDLVEAALRREGVGRQVPVELAHASGAAAILLRSDLIAVVPSVLARIYCEDEGLQAYPVPFDFPPMEVKQFWHRTVHADPAVTWLRRLVRDMYQQALPP
ncbi:MAG TPA: LysR substrate-binding domain-containing protein, partial [Ramlibacter sp.]